LFPQIAVALADKFAIHIDKYADIIRELVAHGADPHAKNEHNESPASLVAHSDTLTENGGAELLKGALGLLVSSAKTTKSLLFSQPSGIEGAKISGASNASSGGSASGVLTSRVSFMMPSSPPPVVDGASFGFAADQGGSLSLIASTGDLAAPEIGSPTNAEQQQQQLQLLPSQMQPQQSEVARAKHLSMLRLGYKALFAALQKYGFEAGDPDFDSNTSYLHTRNLHAGFAAMGVPLSASDVELLEKIMDIDRDGSVDEADFLKMMLRFDTERDTRAALDRAVRWLDADADGAISAADLRDSAKRVGALLHCANDRELLAIARSVAAIPDGGGSSSSAAAAAAPAGAAASAAAALSAQQRLAALQLHRAHIEHMAQYVLDAELMRRMDDEEMQAEVALASERARAMATSGFTMGRNRGRRTSTFITSGF
jgi:Ca2+-binding EF-hand superfamily protein